MTDQTTQPILNIPANWAPNITVSAAPLAAPVAVEGWISAKAVREAFGISDMTLWRWCGDPTVGFPRPVKFGNRRFFSARFIAEWQAARMADAQRNPLT